MPDGYSNKELAKPPGKRELARIDKEYEALKLWYAKNDLRAVRDGIPGCNSLNEARILVNRGIERFEDERKDNVRRMRVRHTMMLEEVLTKLYEAIDAGDLGKARELKMIQERQSALNDLDMARREQTNVGVNIVVNAGLPDIPDVPLRAERGEYPELIDGEVVE